VLGRTWQGSSVDPVPVLYIALEGSSGMKRRRLAWCKRHGIIDPNTLAIHFADGFLDIREGAVTRKRIIEYALAHGIKWIVIDTLSRAMAGGEESGAKDMGAAFLGADEIRRLSGAHVTLVHHTGKDQSKGGRGSSLLVGNIDTEIQITREGGNRAARLTKQKEGEDGTVWQFKVEQIDLGYQNKRGKPVSSAVAVVGLVDDFASADDLSERETAALKILEQLIRDSQTKNSDGAATVSLTTFQRSLSVHNWPKSQCTRSARSNALKRALEALSENNKILIKNDNISLFT
jgi:AAA domain